MAISRSSLRGTFLAGHDEVAPERDGYERVCARCLEARAAPGWFSKSFSMLVDMTDRRELERHLCPECAVAFPDDAARVTFLESTLPARYLKLPGS